jgi:hypothetical protein
MFARPKMEWASARVGLGIPWTPLRGRGDDKPQEAAARPCGSQMHKRANWTGVAVLTRQCTTSQSLQARVPPSFGSPIFCSFSGGLFSFFPETICRMSLSFGSDLKSLSNTSSARKLRQTPRASAMLCVSVRRRCRRNTAFWTAPGD